MLCQHTYESQQSETSQLYIPIIITRTKVYTSYISYSIVRFTKKTYRCIKYVGQERGIEIIAGGKNGGGEDEEEKRIENNNKHHRA